MQQMDGFLFMNLDLLPDHLKLVTTSDGSPSMEIIYSNVSEWMHSSHGAFEESCYIYLHALNLAHEKGLPLRILSVGLGLGYNEILSAGFSLSKKLTLSIQSYENEPFLVESFKHWSVGTLKSTDCLFPVYEKILEMTAQKLNLSVSKLRETIQDLGRNHQFIHLGELSASGPFPPGQTLIYFDAFSNKASPDLWTPDFLEIFVKSTADASCLLSTYAATGNLKRSLVQNGFEVDLRPGFAGKRNSILGFRPLSRNPI